MAFTGNRLGKAPKGDSWLMKCQVSNVDKAGVDGIGNPKHVKYWGMFQTLDFEDSDNDLDWVVTRGDRLDLIALKIYGDAMLWWVIADKNEMDQPAVDVLNVGRIITIPDPAWVQTQVVGIQE